MNNAKEAQKNLESLIGLTLSRITKFEDHSLFLYFGDGSIWVLRAERECCDRSWFEHITLPTLGGKVTYVAIRDEYLVEIHTSNGDLILEFRNDGGDSGCYDGELDVYLVGDPDSRYTDEYMTRCVNEARPLEQDF